MIVPAERLRDVGEYYFSRKLEQIRRMREAGDDVINLGIGSPDLPPPVEAIAAARAALESPTAHGYSAHRGTEELRCAISEMYAETYRVTRDPNSEILPLLGSKEGIFYLSLAYLNPGDRVLVPNPGYPAYAAAAKLLGAEAIPYELRAETGWMPDLDTLAARDLSRVKIFWINYPHMPTGAAGSKELFRRLIDFARPRKMLLCNDLPYGQILNPEAPRSLLQTVRPEDHAFCAELNSLSKTYQMAGWRAGMLLASGPVIQAVLTAKSNVDSGMFSVVQAGACAAFKAPDTWHRERNATFSRRREIAWQIFSMLGFSWGASQVGMFVWAKAPDQIPDVESFADALLKERRVFITPGSLFGTAGERYARLSLCVSEARLTEAKLRLEGACGSPS